MFTVDHIRKLHRLALYVVNTIHRFSALAELFEFIFGYTNLERPAQRPAHVSYTDQNVCKKVKFSHSRYRALGPELIPVYRQAVSPHMTF